MCIKHHNFAKFEFCCSVSVSPWLEKESVDTLHECHPSCPMVSSSLIDLSAGIDPDIINMAYIPLTSLLHYMFGILYLTTHLSNLLMCAVKQGRRPIGSSDITIWSGKLAGLIYFNLKCIILLTLTSFNIKYNYTLTVK